MSHWTESVKTILALVLVAFAILFTGFIALTGLVDTISSIRDRVKHRTKPHARNRLSISIICDLVFILLAYSLVCLFIEGIQRF